MGIAIVVPIERLLEILDYPRVRDGREKFAAMKRS